MARYKCAWCEAKGITTYLNDIVFEGDIDSHGICKECKKEMDKEFDKIREYNKNAKGNKGATRKS